MDIGLKPTDYEVDPNHKFSTGDRDTHWILMHVRRRHHAAFQSNVSAISDSDVGDQYMLITFIQIFSMLLTFHCYPQANDSQSINVFLSVPLAVLPSIIPVNAIASNWLFLTMCPTNRICLLTITFRKCPDVLALWSLLYLTLCQSLQFATYAIKTTFVWLPIVISFSD